MASISSTKVMVAAILGFFLYGSIASMLGTLLPYLSARDHLSPAQMGDVALVQALGLMIASIVTGPLIDNRGKKTGMILGLALIVMALIGLPASTGWVMVSGSMFLLGLGGGAIVNASNTLVSDLSDEKRASFFSLAHVFFGAGGLFTPLVAANLLGGNGIKLSILVASMAVVVTLIMFFIAMPPPLRDRAFGFSAALDLKGKPLLVLLSFFVFLYVSCEVGFWNWLPKYMMSEGISQKSALNILALGFASGMLVGRVIAVKVLAKVSASRAALVCAVLMVGVMFWALRSPSPMMAWVSVFASGVVMGPVFPSSMAMTGDAFPVMTATCLGIVSTAGWAGTAVSSYVVGAIAGQDVNRLHTALLIFPAAAVMMVLIGLVLQPMLRKGRTATAAA